MGKTSVLHIFRKLGAYIFDIDKIVHDILKKPGIIIKISRALGSNVLRTGPKKKALNKKKVADIIFSEPDKRTTVENIIHPEVLKIIKLTKSKILRKDPSAFILFEVPLLFEAGYEKHFDKVIAVHCKRDTAISRLKLKGFSREEALRRMRAQMPITRKKKLADYVIDNNGSIRSTENKVKRVLQRLR